MDEPSTVGWPEFEDGDVDIQVSGVAHYRLHSSILRRSSPDFASLLKPENATKLTTWAKQQKRAPFKLELIRNPQNQIGTFVRVNLSENGTVERGDSSHFNVSYPGQSEVDQYWDWLFGIFYHVQPTFSDHNLAVTLAGCMGLIDVAETVGATDHVRPYIDLALTRHDHALWTSIASSPAPWVEMGRRAHSDQIFSEGCIHLIGRWQNISDHDKAEMHVATRELCERKHKEIDIAKEAIELRMLGHYPASLHKIAANKPGRFTYQNDIYMWMVISFFRQWFAQSIADSRNRVSPDGGYAFYKALSKGGKEYLDRVTFRDFHKFFPMSSKACNVLEGHMHNYKEEIKEFVKDLVMERTHVSSTSYRELKWLTCAVINKDDLPWKLPTDEDEDAIRLYEALRNGVGEQIQDPVTPTANLDEQLAGSTVKQVEATTNGTRAEGESSPLSEAMDFDESMEEMTEVKIGDE